jgi:phosphate:Na+ symporter
MAEARRRRVRPALLWALTACVIAFATFDSNDEPASARVRADGYDASHIRITAISDTQVAPGDAIVLSVDGLDDAPPVEATVGKRAAPVLERHGADLVVRIPDDEPQGKSSIRIGQGARRSKPYDLQVRRPRLAKSLRNLIGGLALLLIGLDALSRGLRKLAGHRLRRRLGELVRSAWRAVGTGVLVGGATQLATTAAALIVNLSESELIAPASAVALLVGAHLGSALTGALLPFAITRDSLLIVAAGVLWQSLAADRRGQAIGHLFVGAGLVLYGLHVVDTGVAPFVAHPATLPFVRFLESGSFGAIAACVALGVLLATLLQGPGPLFGLVVGLLQVSGTLGLTNALAMLAGTPLGAALGTTLVAWPMGRSARRLAWAHLRMGALATGMMAATCGLWARLAIAIGPGELGEHAFGQRILYPRAHAHLAIGFLAAQLASTALVVLILPRLSRKLAPRAVGARITGSAEVPALAQLVPACQDALKLVPTLVQHGNRDEAGEAERQLERAARSVEAQLATGTSVPRPPLVAAIHLTSALGELVRVAERGVERGIVLDAEQQKMLAGVHELVAQGLSAVGDALLQGAVELEPARAREIRLNAREAEARRVLAAGDGAPAGAVQLGALLDAYEGVGNRVWRALEAAALEVDDPLD